MKYIFEIIRYKSILMKFSFIYVFDFISTEHWKKNSKSSYYKINSVKNASDLKKTHKLKCILFLIVLSFIFFILCFNNFILDLCEVIICRIVCSVFIYIYVHFMLYILFFLVLREFVCVQFFDEFFCVYLYFVAWWIMHK